MWPEYFHKSHSKEPMLIYFANLISIEFEQLTPNTSIFIHPAKQHLFDTNFANNTVITKCF